MGKYYLGTGNNNQINFQVVDSTGVINDLNLSGLYLSATGKALDADKLDNLDSSYFRNAANLTGVYTGQISGGGVGNADTLDNYDSSYFLNASNITGTLGLNATGLHYISGSLTVDTSTLFVDAVNDRVGIGTTVPAARLDIYHASSLNGFQQYGKDGVRFRSPGAFNEHGYIEYPSGGDKTVLGSFYSGGGFGQITLRQHSSVTSQDSLTINNAGNVGIAGSLYADGNVGVGTFSTTSPWSRVLQVYNSNNSALSVKSAARDWQISTAADGKLNIYDNTASAHRLNIDTSGNVGIGTTSPGATLTVATVDTLIRPALGLRQANALAYGYDFDTETAAVGRLDLYSVVNGVRTQAMSWRQDNGNVGIGTASPADKLQVAGSAVVDVNLFVGAGNASRGVFIDSYGSYLYGMNRVATGMDIRAGSVAGNQLFIKTNGNVGIGTASPQTTLEIFKTTSSGKNILHIYNNSAGASSTVGIGWSENDATNGNYNSYLYTVRTPTNEVRLDATTDKRFVIRTGTGGSDPTERMTVLSGGNVGIGATAPGSKLEVSGQISASAGSNSAPAYSFASDLDTGIYSPTTDQLGITTGGLIRARFTSTEIRVGNNLNTLDLGVESKFIIVGSENTPALGTLIASLGFSNESNQAGQTSAEIAKILVTTQDATANQGRLEFQTKDGTTLATRMMIDKSGNVGVGTTSPVSLFELKSAAPVITLNGTDNAQTKGIDFATNGSVQASIRSNIQSGEFKFSSGTSGFGGFMVFATDTVERMRIAATSGNVSIASTAASSSSLTGALQVAGGIGVGAASYFGGNVTSTGVIVSAPASGWAIIGTTGASAGDSSVARFEPFGAQTGSNPAWFIGHRFSAHGNFAIWAYNGGGHVANYLTIAASTGAATFAGAVAGAGGLSLTSGGQISQTGGGTSQVFNTITTTAGTMYVGVDSSASAVFGGPAYAAYVMAPSGKTLILGSVGNGAITIASTGTATFASTVTATGAIVSNFNGDALGGLNSFRATVSSGQTAGLTLGQSGVTNWNFLNTATTGTLAISTGGGVGLTITTGGNVSINSGNLTVSGAGTSTFAGAVTITGDLTVNGTTTTVNSTTVTVDDPIITLGGDTVPTVDDNKDRGVEFRWHNGTVGKVGFFGLMIALDI